jgi:hypothetical protein
MLEQAPTNKMQKRDAFKEPTEQAFFYPDYQITINAPTQAEADIKLAEYLKGK